MANILAPFGFSPDGTTAGAGPNFRLSTRKIASTNATPIFSGDVVAPTYSTATGYIQQYSSTIEGLPSTPLANPCGIFWGCKYLSASQGNIVRSRYWPGSDANGDVTAYVIDSPDTTFLCQSTQATAILLASVGQNVAVSFTSTAGVFGNTLTGQSQQGITTPTTTATLPFIITGLLTDPAGVQGTDLTTPYNYVIVGWNTEIYKAGQAAFS